MNTEAPRYLWKIQYVGRHINRGGGYESRVVYIEAQTESEAISRFKKQLAELDVYCFISVSIVPKEPTLQL